MDQMTFEEAYEKLSSIVKKLERSETGLQESLDEFEEGVRLVRYCNDLLDKAQNKISMLQMNEGQPELVPFEAEE